jgi:hypothetical protein
MSREPFEPDKEVIEALYAAASQDARAVIQAVLAIEAETQTNVVKKIGDRIRSFIVENEEQ